MNFLVIYAKELCYYKIMLESWFFQNEHYDESINNYVLLSVKKNVVN